MNEYSVPCKICGKATTSRATERCNGCWEVESRLADYLKNPKGLAFARSMMPVLDDWVDGKPDAWDYEAVLTENGAEIVWSDSTIDDISNHPACEFLAGWSLIWKQGAMFIGNTSETIARKAGALFVCLWLRGVSASFADKLMDGFVVFLERQEGITKGFMVKVGRRTFSKCLHLETFSKEDRLLKEFGLKKGDLVGVTLSKLQEG